MVDSWSWELALDVQLCPSKWRLAVGVETPNVIHCLLFGISSKKYEVWRGEGQSVPIPLFWSLAGDLDLGPQRLVSMVSHHEERIVRELSSWMRRTYILPIRPSAASCYARSLCRLRPLLAEEGFQYLVSLQPTF